MPVPRVESVGSSAGPPPQPGAEAGPLAPPRRSSSPGCLVPNGLLRTPSPWTPGAPAALPPPSSPFSDVWAGEAVWTVAHQRVLSLQNLTVDCCDQILADMRGACLAPVYASLPGSADQSLLLARPLTSRRRRKPRRPGAVPTFLPLLPAALARDNDRCIASEATERTAAQTAQAAAAAEPPASVRVDSGASACSAFAALPQRKRRALAAPSP